MRIKLAAVYLILLAVMFYIPIPHPEISLLMLPLFLYFAYKLCKQVCKVAQPAKCWYTDRVLKDLENTRYDSWRGSVLYKEVDVTEGVFVEEITKAIRKKELAEVFKNE